MRIGIVTVGNYWNYGNRLQNVALKRAIEKESTHEVVSIKHWQHEEELYRWHKVHNAKDFGLYLRSFTGKYGQRRRREYRFIDFSNKYLAETTDTAVDLAVVGSDQVWNAEWMSPDQFGFFMLNDFNVPKVSYAASFGVNDIREPFQQVMNEALPSYKRVTVRESRGKELVESITGVPADVVLDPTMLLTKDEWNELFDFAPEKKPVIFTYFLSPKNDAMANLLSQLVDEFGYEVVEYHNLTTKQKQYYRNDPREFVHDLASASVVLTDSFHASVFSILYHVPFVVSGRSEGVNMNSRLETLFGVTGLTGRWVADVKSPQQATTINYTGVDERLAEARQSSRNILADMVTMG